MGGRGASSGAKGGMAQKGASGAQSFSELKTYMQAQGVRFGAGLENKDLGMLRTASEEILNMRKEFPQAVGAFTELNGEEARPGVYASASRVTGNIMVSGMMSNVEKARQTYNLDVALGFHPKGTTSDHIVTHESGHILEKALLDKAYANDPYGRQAAFFGRTEAKRIVKNAVMSIKKTPEGKGARTESLIGQISKYASKNRSEPLAEAVADYRANGAKAKPLSRAIWAELKKELG